MGILVVVFCILVALCYISGGSKEKYKTADLTSEDKTASDILDEIIIRCPSISLHRGETCFFEANGYSYHTREVVTGYNRKSYGSSIHIAKGLSAHRSSGYSQAIRETQKTKYPGRLFITNERVVFLAERKGFDIGFDKLSNISTYKKYIEVFAGSRFYRVYTPQTKYIRDLIALMNRFYEEQCSACEFVCDDED